MRTRASILALLIAASNSMAAVTISNLSASQREGSKLVDIYFDADNSDGVEISVSVIVSNGTEKVNASSFFGDYGNNVSVGTGLQVVWDGGADLNDVVTTDLSITLQASEPASSGMVHIPAGTNVGSDPDFGSYSLTVADFLMDDTEITGSEWQTVYNWAFSNGYIFRRLAGWKAIDYPANFIDWYDAVVWCNARSEMEGLTPCYLYSNGTVIRSLVNEGPVSWDDAANGYRLASDIEFEYAARGGLSGNRFPWGNIISHEEANYLADYSWSYDDSEQEGYHPDYDDGVLNVSNPVEDFAPNAYGLYGMSGNVWEWCWDFSNGMRSQRSGSYNDTADQARCRHRDLASPKAYDYSVGIRTVRDFFGSGQLSETIAFDSRDYELTVSSEYGSPVPMIGNHDFAWKATVTCSVESAVMVNGTNFTCTGWSGGGSVPMVGSSNEVMVVLNDLSSSIAWNWASDDTDLDGMDDDWELLYFGNLGQAETNDFDSDGQDNGSEYIAGTNPTNPASLFQLQETFANGKLILAWPTASNRIYTIYWTDNLKYTTFTNLMPDLTFPHNSATVTPVKARTFYKMDVRNP